MTRKDYILIAEAIREPRERAQREWELTEGESWKLEANVIDNIALRIASRLKADNPRFNSERFLETCGVEVIF